MGEPFCRIARMPSGSDSVNQHSFRRYDDRTGLTTTCLASTDLTLLSSQYIHPPRDCTKAVSAEKEKKMTISHSQS